MSKKIISRLLGPWSSLAVSILCSIFLLFYHNYSGVLVTEVILLIGITRLIQISLSKPASQFLMTPTNESLSKVVSVEIQVSFIFLTACYLVPWPLTVSVAVQIVLVNLVMQLGWAWLVSKLRDGAIKNLASSGALKGTRQALIIGTGPQAMKATNSLLDGAESDLNLLGFLDFNRSGMWRYRDVPLIGHPQDIKKLISGNQVDYVIVAVEPEELMQTLPVFETAEKMGVTICLMTQIYQPTIATTRPTFIKGQSIIEYSTVPVRNIASLLKNLFDRMGAVIGLIIISPLMILTSIAIKLDSRGSVLFKQTRTGLSGRPFQLWKFRTMTTDAEDRKQQLQEFNEMSGPVFKIANDPRVTKIGKFLRKYSIDELPQLFNVLRGEMSLVGPRPPLPNEVLAFEPWQHRKLSVKPGLTCLWQTNGRNDIDFDEWMKLDLKYIDNWSLWEDTKIMARTIPTVLKGSGK